MSNEIQNRRSHHIQQSTPCIQSFNTIYPFLTVVNTEIIEEQQIRGYATYNCWEKLFECSTHGDKLERFREVSTGPLKSSFDLLQGHNEASFHLSDTIDHRPCGSKSLERHLFMTCSHVVREEFMGNWGFLEWRVWFEVKNWEFLEKIQRIREILIKLVVIAVFVYVFMLIFNFRLQTSIMSQQKKQQSTAKTQEIW